VGACYQPVDRSPEQIDQDIAIMKGAGFNVVRMGDLSWDSFEPSQGKFAFEWFDRIMDKMQAAGIRVILRPAGSHLAASSTPWHRYRRAERHAASTRRALHG
jgi:beta-galactosidase